MIAGPQYDLSDREMKMLRDFWNKDGRILVLVDPAAKTPKLLAFLNELGVKVDDDRSRWRWSRPGSRKSPGCAMW